jgi:hypothetical protein
MTIRRMRIACRTPKATNTHTGCVILIAFPLQQRLHERASMLRGTHINCPVQYRMIVNVRTAMGVQNASISRYQTSFSHLWFRASSILLY